MAGRNHPDDPRQNLILDFYFVPQTAFTSNEMLPVAQELMDNLCTRIDSLFIGSYGCSHDTPYMGLEVLHYRRQFADEPVRVIRVMLRDYPEAQVKQITEDLENARRRLSGGENPWKELFETRFGTEQHDVTVAVLMPHDKSEIYRPSITRRVERDIVYFGIDHPLPVSAQDAQWGPLVEAAQQFGEWFETGFNTAVSDRLNADSGTAWVDAETRDDPPAAGPLTPDFYTDLTNFLAYLADHVGNETISALVGYGIKAGFDRIRHELQERNLPEPKIKVDYSPAHLANLAKDYVRNQYHPSAKLYSSYEAVNRRWRDGHEWADDTSAPSGWDVWVRSYSTRYRFRVLSDLESVALTVFSNDSEPLDAGNVSLMPPGEGE